MNDDLRGASPAQAWLRDCAPEATELATARQAIEAREALKGAIADQAVVVSLTIAAGEIVLHTKHGAHEVKTIRKADRLSITELRFLLDCDVDIHARGLSPLVRPHSDLSDPQAGELAR